MKIYAVIAALALPACGGGSANPSPIELPDSFTPIATIQGVAESSPLVGETVTLSGIVSGDFQDSDQNAANNLGGFYLLSESPDDNPQTSEGLFVFEGSRTGPDVAVGDRVIVTGEVQEHFGETQVVASDVQVGGRASVSPVDVTLPRGSTTTNSDGDTIPDLERYEGMLVRFSQPLVVTNLRNLERFGEVGLAAGKRPQQFTNLNAPSRSGYTAHKRETGGRSVILDDGRRDQSPDSYRYMNVRAGDTVNNLTGNLRYARGSGGAGDEAWRLMPTQETEFEKTNPRPASPDVAGEFRVASFNVLNYFSTIDSGRPICGPRDKDDCRGADSKQELARQTEKTVSALVLLDADVIGLVEIENDARDAIASLVDSLNDRLGSRQYGFIDTGVIGDDGIKTAFIYRLSTAQPIGEFALLTANIDPRFNDDKNRPVLAQVFEQRNNGARLTIAVAHLKSKGSSCDAEGDPNLRDGQGNCNRTRTNAAAALADWLQSDPTNSGDSDAMLIGDLNGYLREDPLDALQQRGFTNLLAQQQGAYSFLFDAQIGALDHALVSRSLLPQVAGMTEWHINADEAPLLDYNLDRDRDPQLFDGSTPYRSSDHDPVVIGLDLET